MSVYVDGDEKIIYETTTTTTTTVQDERKEHGHLTNRINKGGGEPPTTMEEEKRMRREIANSNERRRMQSINNGFQSLRSLLPHHEGEKLSKAAILQQTAEYIYSLEQEKTRLLSQNCQLKRLVNQHEGGELPPKKRKTEIIIPTTTTESSDEGLGSMSPEPVVGGGNGTSIIVANPNDSIGELLAMLERERSKRRMLETKLRQFETQLYQQQQQQQQQQQVFKVEDGDDLALQLVTPESLPPVGHTQTVVCSPPVSRSPSPEPPQRLPSVLEAAIKAEPKVEVERLPSPNHPTTTASSTSSTSTPAHDNDASSTNRLYLSNTSRQNLETIVEAIRHLEGDHMFAEDTRAGAGATGGQETPLALTTTSRTPVTTTKAGTNELSTFIDFHATASVVQQHQQSRPGVIVVKQAS